MQAMSTAGIDPALIQISSVTAGGGIATVRALFQEYASTLSINLCFQNFAQELATLPGAYAPPRGRLLQARVVRQSAGCIALRAMAKGVGEIKRLYVRPEFRGLGVGKSLVQRVLKEARHIGYRIVRLDTLREMRAAIALYVQFGFVQIAPYRHGEPDEIIYFELDLRRH